MDFDVEEIVVVVVVVDVDVDDWRGGLPWWDSATSHKNSVITSRSTAQPNWQVVVAG